MKHTIAIIGLVFCMHTIHASTIKPTQDTIPFAKWSYGIQAGYFSNSRSLRSFHIGLFGERRFSSLFAIEAELTYAKNYIDWSLFGRENYTSVGPNLSLFSKFYFGNNKRWFSKLGYSFRSKVDPNRDASLIVLGLGHNLKLSNGQDLKLELNWSRNSAHGLIGAFKIGYRF